MKKNKICFVVAADITLKFLLISELRFFKNKGYDVFVVCSPGKWLGEIRKEGIHVKEITVKRNIFSPFSDVKSLLRFFSYFKKEKFDIVLTFTPKPGLLGQLAAQMAGVPVIINTIFGYYFHESTPKLKKEFFIILEKIAAQYSHFIFFRNKEDFATAKTEHIINQVRAEYIGDGINLQKYDNTRFSEEFIKEKKKSLGVATGVPIIGIVARLVREKGYMELFEAFEMITEKFPDAVLLVVGPTDAQKKDNLNLVVLRQAQGRQKNIIFLGERTDVDELYSIMDVFVLPSYREGFPHSVMEASAMARPVVTTDVRGCRNAVENNVTGIIIPAKNVKALADAIISLLSEPLRARAMGQAGKKKAERDFDKNVMMEKMENKIKELMKQKLV